MGSPDRPFTDFGIDLSRTLVHAGWLVRVKAKRVFMIIESEMACDDRDRDDQNQSEYHTKCIMHTRQPWVEYAFEDSTYDAALMTPVALQKFP